MCAHIDNDPVNDNKPSLGLIIGATLGGLLVVTFFIIFILNALRLVQYECFTVSTIIIMDQSHQMQYRDRSCSCMDVFPNTVKTREYIVIASDFY